MRIAYEVHPVSPERKAELRSQGFKILDAAFKPLDLPEAVGADTNGIQAETEAKAETEAHPLDHDGDGKPGGSLPDSVAPRRRGRKPKVAQ
jgi:hypothetical protein